MRIFPINLDAETPASALVTGIGSTFQGTLTPFIRGYSLDAQFHFLRRNPERSSPLPFRYVDPSGWDLMAAIGIIGAIPDLGVWTLTCGATVEPTANVSPTITASAFQAAVRAGMVTNFSTATVSGPDGGPFLLTRGVNGAIATPVADATALLPSGSTIVVSVVQEGSAVLPAQFQIELKRAVPIGRSSGWSALPPPAVNVTVHQAGGTDQNKVFRVAWNPDAYAGEISLLFAGNSLVAEVGPFAWNASPAEIVTAFEAHPAVGEDGVAVAQGSPGEIFITLLGDDIKASDLPTLNARMNSLQVPLGLAGTLNANTAGVVAMLDGEEEAEGTFELRLDMGDGPQCVFQAEAIVRETLLPDIIGVASPIDPTPTESQVIRFYKAVTSKTGGGSSKLDGLSTINRAVGNQVAFQDAGDGLMFYRLVAGTDAEALPAVIRPDDYNGSTNAKVWKEVARAATSYALYRDVKSNGTHGGTFTAGSWQTRTLNETTDADGIGALSSNEVTLAAGKYRFRAKAPCEGVLSNQLRLYNVTDAAVIRYGGNSYGVAGTVSFAECVGEFTITGTKAIRVEHRCANTVATYGLGEFINLGGEEVYTTLELWKVG